MTYHAVDFGTSNSLLSYVTKDGIKPINLEDKAPVLRSLLYTPSQNKWYFGNEAIREYINNEGEGRFLRSIKKFLPEPGYSGTSIFNRNVNISEMVSIFLGEMRKRANKETGENVEKIVLGRPALYSLDKEFDKLAQDRMQKAAEIAGYKEVIFCPEPIAAGLDYQSNDHKERIVLICDFGGGTSDFTLMKISGRPYSQEDILGLSGIFSAGDALDGIMMKDFIAPHFGSGFEYKLPGGTNILTFPRNLLKKICSPAHITHLRERDTWEFLQHINKFALASEDQKKMENLFTLVECQLGFPLFNEIEKVKISLGKEAESNFVYNNSGLDITQNVSDADYRKSVMESVDEIMNTMMEVFKQSSVSPENVDLICLTGGTSQFPLLKEKLRDVFGKEKLREHNIYQSVVNGLSQYALQMIHHHS
jgi:hypothetical chaperone protein